MRKPVKTREAYGTFIDDNIGALRGENRVRPNIVGNPTLSNRKPEAWFNAAAFVAPPAYTFGNVGRNTMRSDGYNNLDFSLFREDRLSERLRSQFRVEAFNLLNTPTFGTPQSSFISPLFGRVSGTVSTARQLQLGLKLMF